MATLQPYADFFPTAFMTLPRYVLDACILMSGVLRPALLTLAEQGFFHPIFSTRIGEEWRRNAARIWAVDPDILVQEWELMHKRFPLADPGDVTPYLHGLRDSDAKDWHVIAAGLASRARFPELQGQVMVMTWNLKDFRRAELRRMGLELTDPDRVLSTWWQQQPNIIEDVLHQTLTDLATAGRPRQGTLIEILRRERLYRLARLIEARTNAAQQALALSA